MKDLPALEKPPLRHPGDISPWQCVHCDAVKVFDGRVIESWYQKEPGLIYCKECWVETIFDKLYR